MITAEINYALGVPGRARFDVIEKERTTVQVAPARVEVRDARPHNAELDLDVDGYRLYQHSFPLAVTGTKAELESTYLDEMCAFIKELTGAREVRPQRSGMQIRRSSMAQGESESMNGRLLPASFAHLDFTEHSIAAFLDLSVADDGPIAPYRRMALYQTWRVTSPPPQDNLLAVADPGSVADEDIFLMDTRLGPEEFPSCFFESRLCTVNPQHNWYYYPNMTPDEVLVFKGHDTDPDRVSGVMHTAFEVPGAPADAVPRSSVEARFMAFFD
ncbi:CmcJ/NvfI family oxidoreductase [Nocardia sp. NPDC050378]|uniref:CmcJ/NvfI family oxidoreductase n=1 Tax=Nocardia sp. NPDC050378 TaxID=3155400 RepID=UPI0033F310E5